MAVDFSPIQEFFSQPSNVVVAKILLHFGWMPVAAVILWGIKELWLYYRGGVWGNQQEHVLLAIDIPRGNDQSVMAVENMFVYFAGAHGTLNLIEEYWIGMYQLSFSFEIVSIDGYTQFIIRTPAKFRNLTESAVYSQYPDAEITEINDYTEDLPNSFPDEEWDVWGAEFILKNKDAYPIKTYPAFLDNFGRPENLFKDPMSTLMDLCSSLNKGEQLWYQILVYPTGFEWVEERDKEVRKILKEKTASGQGILESIIAQVWGLLSEVSRQITNTEFGAMSAAEAKDESLKMLMLKPREKKQVEAIQQKTAKIGFEVKHRFVYFAKKEVINKPKVVNGFVGYMKQFSDQDLNNLKPDMAVTATSAKYFFVEYFLNEKKRKIVSAYKKRSGTQGRKRFIMTVDELATLWHFPVETVVKAPLIQKAPGRKAEPPMSLPVSADLPSASDFSEVLAVNPDSSVKPPSLNRPDETAPAGTGRSSVAAKAPLPWGESPAGERAAPEKPEPKKAKKGEAPSNLPLA